MISKSVGQFFSAVPIGQTAFGKRWNEIREDGIKHFPLLRFKHPNDLHLTIIYVGSWSLENAEILTKLSCVPIPEPMQLSCTLSYFGGGKRIVGIEFHGESPVWKKDVLNYKKELVRLGLKKPEAFDTNFTLHASLVEVPRSAGRPSRKQRDELKAFKDWVQPLLLNNKTCLVLTPETLIEALLAGAIKPNNQNDSRYIRLFDFMTKQFT
jgi:hypothetical protein